MNQPENATSVRYQQADREWAFHIRCQQDFNQQAEAIAKHYVVNAQIALQALRLIKLRQQYEQYLGRNPLNATISRFINEIKANHARDFGIELECRRAVFELIGSLSQSEDE